MSKKSGLLIGLNLLIPVLVFGPNKELGKDSLICPSYQLLFSGGNNQLNESIWKAGQHSFVEQAFFNSALTREKKPLLTTKMRMNRIDNFIAIYLSSATTASTLFDHAQRVSYNSIFSNNINIANITTTHPGALIGIYKLGKLAYGSISNMGASNTTTVSPCSVDHDDEIERVLLFGTTTDTILKSQPPQLLPPQPPYMTEFSSKSIHLHSNNKGYYAFLDSIHCCF